MKIFLIILGIIVVIVAAIATYYFVSAKQDEAVSNAMLGSGPCDKCPEITNEDWDDIKFTNWEGKMFYTLDQSYLFYVPMKPATSIKNLQEAIAKKGYTLKEPFFCLFTGDAFRGKIMGEIAYTSQEDPNIYRFGKIDVISKVHSGEYSGINKSMVPLLDRVRKEYSKGPDRIYFWYANCPKCWKKQGKKTVIFAEVKP